MEPLAVELATARLERAKRALEEFEAAKSHKAAEAAWADFLLASSNIYSKLEQGAKGNGKSAGWFGRQKRMRADDPVMRYLHHARNSEEHGLELITERHPDGGNNQGFGEKTEWIIQTIDEKTGALGEPVPGWMYGPHVKLAAVRDRGVLYSPPDVVRPHGDPHVNGTYAIERLAAMIAEAAELASARG